MFLGLLDPDPLVMRFGSFYHQAKIVRKTLIHSVLQLLYEVVIYVNAPSKSNKQKN